MPNDRSVLDLPYQTTAADNDSVVADINNAVSRIKITTLKKIIGQWSEIDNKPFSSLNVNHFSSVDSVLSISNDIITNLHTHSNKNCIDKLSEDNEGNLLYDGSPIKTSLAFDDISDDFAVIDDELCISSEIKNDFHNHSNKTVIDKFSENNGTLLYDGEEISSNSIDFSSLSNSLTGGTLTGINIVPDSVNETFDITVTGIPQIDINASGYWTIDGVSTGQKAQGDNGATPIINESDKHWYINGVDTNVIAEGQDGDDGQNGITPSIDSVSKHWIIGSTDTGVIAEGQNGQNGITPSIDPTSKHWMIGSTDTNINAEGQDGYSPTVSFTNITGGRTMSVVTGSGTVTTDIMDGVTSLSTDKVDLSCTLLASGWSNSVPYTQTVSVNGITASLNPRIDISISSTVETGIAEETAWGYITKATTATNSITFYCYQNKPTVDLNVMIEVV